MDAPQYDKRELREALPLAATPSPASTPSSNPDSKTGAMPAKRFEMPSAAEVDELRLGFVPTVNPLQALAEMKSAAAAPPPSPAPPPAAAAHVYSPAFAPSGSSALRGASPYFASNAPVAPAKKRPLIINANQRGNLLMKYIKNAPYEFATDLGPDFVFTPSACGFYLSMRYHMLNKPYIAGRVQEVKAYALRVVLCHVDSTDDSAAAIRELSQQCLGLNVTLILAWSYKEVARYVETFKQYEGRPATMLQERVEESEKFADVLQVVRFVNKTDVQTLAHSFGTLRRIANASMEELSLCPGLGARKVQKLHAAFTDPLDPAVGRKKQKATEISSFLTRAPPSEDVVSERSSER